MEILEQLDKLPSKHEARILELLIQYTKEEDSIVGTVIEIEPKRDDDDDNGDDIGDGVGAMPTVVAIA